MKYERGADDLIKARKLDIRADISRENANRIRRIRAWLGTSLSTINLCEMRASRQ